MVAPYYADEFVTLYCADARDVLAELAYDAVLTDPPYGIEGGSGGDSKDFAKGSYLASGWEDTPAYIAEIVVPLIEGLVATGCPMAVTPGVRNLFLYPKPSDIGCFWTPAGATHSRWGFVTYHPILFYGRDHRAGKGALPNGLAVTESAEKNGHPCPKPLKAWTWLLDKVALPGQVVLDPFAGSGTTLRAAKDRGRKAIGIEIEERYCEIAVRRLGQEVLFGEVAA